MPKIIKKEPVNFYVYGDLKERLRKHCTKVDITMTDAFRMALEMYLESVKVRRKKKDVQ